MRLHINSNVCHGKIGQGQEIERAKKSSRPKWVFVFMNQSGWTTTREHTKMVLDKIWMKDKHTTYKKKCVREWHKNANLSLECMVKSNKLWSVKQSVDLVFLNRLHKAKHHSLTHSTSMQDNALHNQSLLTSRTLSFVLESLALTMITIIYVRFILWVISVTVCPFSPHPQLLWSLSV